MKRFISMALALLMAVALVCVSGADTYAYDKEETPSSTPEPEAEAAAEEQPEQGGEQDGESDGV